MVRKADGVGDLAAITLAGARPPALRRRRQSSSADLAWFCVDGDTPRSEAMCDRRADTSAAPISDGWRISLNNMKRRAQCT